MINPIIQKKASISSLNSISGRDYKRLDVENYGVFEWASAGVVDNMFVFAASGGGVWIYDVLSSKGVYRVSMAKILAGDATDKTGQLNDIFAHSGVKTVLVDAQQTITISLVLTIPAGKSLRVEPGGSFTGNGTINGGIIDLSNTAQAVSDIFAGTLTLNFASVITSTLRFPNFGSFPVTGKSGILYIDAATPEAYLWDGANYSTVGGGGAVPPQIVNVIATPYNPAYTTGDIILLVDCTTAGGPVTINLPTAVGNTAKYTIKKVDVGTDSVTTDANLAETIDGDLTAIILFKNTAFSIASDNTNWRRI